MILSRQPVSNTIIRTILIIASIALVAGWCYLLYRGLSGTDFGDKLGFYSIVAAYGATGLLSAIIFLIAGGRMANLYFGLFLFSLSLLMFFKIYVPFDIPLLYNLRTYILSAFCGTCFIHACKEFPQHLSPQALDHYFKDRKAQRLKRFLQRFTSSSYLWLIIFPVLLLLSILSFWVKPLISLVVLFIIITGMYLFLINIKMADEADRKKTLWFFWGILLDLIIIFMGIILSIFLDISYTFNLVVNFLLLSVFLGSLCMGIFYAGAMDARLVIRRTAVYGLMFLAFVFTFAVTEHLVVHYLAHLLHINDQLLNAIFAGIFSLFVKPLHEKLEHRIQHFVSSGKKNAGHSKVQSQNRA